MKINDWLKDANDRLSRAGIATARLDSLTLLEGAILKDRSWLLAHPETTLQGPILQLLEKQLERRKKHEPLAYIRGKSEFYGRGFIVNSHTLEPRSETETMIDLLKNLPCKDPYKDGPCNIIDVGTGSGCLAITSKLEVPVAEVYATDIDKKCIETARHNAEKHGVKMEFFEGDLLSSIPINLYQSPTIILANLPYVPDGHIINQAAMFEPKHAIFGGADGLDLYRQLFSQIANLPQKPQYILSESLPFQHEKMTKASQTTAYSLKKTADFIQIFKFNN